MRIAVGSDEAAQVTDAVLHELRAKGHTLVLAGALAEDDDARWPSVAHRVGQLVAGNDCEEGILFCYTGTGVSMAANKVSGIRAALCGDAPTAAGASVGTTRMCWR